MPTTNLYFNNFSASLEQNLIEDLIIESIRIYGIDVFYLPRTLVNESELFTEDRLSIFKDKFQLEMYIKSFAGFGGQGDFMSKFNLQIRDEMFLVVSRRRFAEEVTKTTEEIGRPSEGDLIYFPLNGKIFEVKFVEHESTFYQMGSLQVYELRCELFEYSHERFDTGLEQVDEIEDQFSLDKLTDRLLDEDGEPLEDEDGMPLFDESFKMTDSDPMADNDYFKEQADQIVNWSESNPFGEAR